jgi:precorrin-6A/cobalt-precorrin-6A reductase
VSARPVLILGGTGEARELAEALHAAGVPVVSSLAGRVPHPRLPPGEVRTGGFGGVEGLSAWLRDHEPGAVVDATHPFAAGMAANAASACARTDVPLLRLERPGWAERPGDRWHWVADVEEAACAVGRLGRRAFLTLGGQELGAFNRLDDVWFLLRSVAAPPPPLPPRHEVVLARGPFTVEGEHSLLEAHAIDVIVARDSGGDQTAAKLTAARERGLPVIVVRRPGRPEVPHVSSVAEATAWAAARTSAGAGRSSGAREG